MSTFLKNLAKSRTVIFNVLVVSASVLALLQGHEVIVQYPELVYGIGVAIGVVNVALRIVTASSLFDSSKDESKKS